MKNNKTVFGFAKEELLKTTRNEKTWIKGLLENHPPINTCGVLHEFDESNDDRTGYTELRHIVLYPKPNMDIKALSGEIEADGMIDEELLSPNEVKRIVIKKFTRHNDSRLFYSAIKSAGIEPLDTTYTGLTKENI